MIKNLYVYHGYLLRNLDDWELCMHKLCEIYKTEMHLISDVSSVSTALFLLTLEGVYENS